MTSAKIPFCDLTRLADRIASPASLDAVDIMRSARFIDGPHTAALETELAAALDAPHVVACANGTDALVLSLVAAGIGAGDVVALPALTFWATLEAVRLVGATPLLVDVDRDDLQMSIGWLGTALNEGSESVSAVILPHLFGWHSAKLTEWRRLCAALRVPLIEDGAQAFGVRHNGRSVFADATFGTLSFYPSKVIGGCGDGGAVTCQTAEQAALLRSLRNHGRAPSGGYGHERVGMNSRMSEIEAAYLRRVVAMREEILRDRRDTLGQYGCDMPPGIELAQGSLDTYENGYLAVCTHATRSGDEMVARMAERGVECGRVYPRTIGELAGMSEAESAERFPVAHSYTRRCFQLPLWYGMTEDEVGRVIQTVREV